MKKLFLTCLLCTASLAMIGCSNSGPGATELDVRTPPAVDPASAPPTKFIPGEVTRTLVPKRRLLSTERISADQIREGVRQYAKLASHLKDPSKKFSCAEDRIAAPSAKEPKILSVELADYDRFNDLRESINGHRVDVDNFPCWIVEVDGYFHPLSRGMKSSRVSHLLLAFTEDGDLVSRIETTKEAWDKSLEHRKALPVKLSS